MTVEDEPTMRRPSLRIAEMAITNFRSFRARTVLPFTDGRPEADAIVTFHGDNGAGKSNAITALDELFLALTLCLSQGDEAGELLLTWDAPMAGLERSFVVAYRNRPAGTDAPTDIEVRFEDQRLGAFRVRAIPSGKRVRLRAEHRPVNPAAPAAMLAEGGFAPVRPEARDQLLTWLQTPLGPQSRPLAIFNARRQPNWLLRSAHGSLLHPDLAEQLFAVRTNRDPEARERWRTFGETLQQFPQFQGKIIDIERPKSDQPPEITVEEPRKTVLLLDELSSGEQQLVVLLASIMLANTPIVVLEEPELSLDEKNQRKLRQILEGLVKAGQIDQIILESHVPAFDGEHVLRFGRSSTGSTEVERVHSAGPKELQIRQHAKEQGAEQSWVTRDGYTQLPEPMRDDLQIGNGAHVWFLKNHDRWGAWPESELEKLFTDDEETRHDDE